MDNMFANLPSGLPDETFETPANSGTVHIERIVSRGQCAPAEGWYDQAHKVCIYDDSPRYS